MVFQKPSDVVVMFAMMGVLFGVVGLAVAHINQEGTATGDYTIFTDIAGQVDSTTGLKKSSDSSTTSLDPPTDEGGEPTEEGIIVRGLQGLKDMSASYKAFEFSLTKAQSALGIPPIILSALASVMIVSLFLMIYTWWRGRQ